MYAVLIEIDDSCRDYHTKYTRSTPVIDSRGKVYDTVKEAMDDAKWYVRHIDMGCVSIRNSDGFKMADDGLSFVASNGNLIVKAALAVDKLSTLSCCLDKPAEADQIVGEAIGVIHALMNELKEKDN